MDPLTFDELFDVVRLEKSRDALQELPENFYERLKLFIQDKKRFLELKMRQLSTFNQEEIEKEKRNFENVKRLVNDLYSIRERKIMQLAAYFAITNSDLIDKSAMLPFEQELFNKTVKILREYREKELLPILNGEVKQEEKEEEKEITVRIKEEIPQFIANNTVYGPFHPEDILDLPREIAEILIKKEKAERIGEETD